MNDSIHDRDRRDYILRELSRRLQILEANMSVLRDQVNKNTFQLEQGMSFGAQRKFADIKEDSDEIHRQLDVLQTKTTRWEGGGAMLYMVISAVGVFIGWLLSKVPFK